MTQFKVGDRVAVYDAERELYGAYGTVTEDRYPAVTQEFFNVRLDQPNRYAQVPTVHTKQCRRLVKKERRRVWLWKSDLEQRRIPVAIAWDEKAYDPQRWIEFIEVRKKK